MRLIYLHGFRSSSQSFKARLLKARMQARGRDADFLCPDLSPEPDIAVATVLRDIAPRPDDTLVGSSLGGYYATHLAERHGLKALLVNPAVSPHRMFDGYLGTQKNLYTDETWELTQDHVTALAELEVPAPQDAGRYQVWLQTGDETLDYRLAQQYYRACALRIQAGGDHGYQGFAQQLPALLCFAGIGADQFQSFDFSSL